MKHLIIRELNNVAEQLLQRLFVRAQELNLHKRDLFVLTAKCAFEAKLKSYILGIKAGEDISIEDFVKEAEEIISSLIISQEDPYFV